MLENNHDYFRAFVNISKAISSTLKLKKVLNLILENAVEFLELSAGVISLWNKTENKLEIIAHLNVSQEFLDKGPVYADRSMPRALTTRKPVIIPDISFDDQLQYPEACKKEGFKALLSIPIIFKDDVIGVLRLYKKKVREFSSQEIEFMTAIAELGGIAINNARYLGQLKIDHAREMDELWNYYSDMVETPRD
ncbi:MAG: GAF domain-containing protein [Candidatus Marinimicrobia bacterium]|nr:GAF domain-containing protein [Candidatus Neomarinimicrobiota bacterium]